MKFPSSYTKIVGNVVTSNVKAEDGENQKFHKLSYSTWLPFAAKTYCISPNIEDYVIKTMPLMPSDLPNRNGIGFPLQELLRYQPPPIARQVYKAWQGCPVHLEHDNEDHTKAKGVVLDTSMVPIKGYGGGRYYKVMGLVGVCKQKDPDLAQKVFDNKIKSGSMGALADEFKCSICGSTVHTKKESNLNCNHMTSCEDVNWRIIDGKLAFIKAYHMSPIEFSIVEDPAWCEAHSDHVLDW